MLVSKQVKYTRTSYLHFRSKNNRMCIVNAYINQPCLCVCRISYLRRLSAGAVALAAGNAHTCALLMGGTVDCWGSNDDGQLGTGDTSERDAPTAVTGLGSGAAVIYIYIYIYIITSLNYIFKFYRSK